MTYIRRQTFIAGGCDELNAAVNQGKLSVDVAEKIAKRPVKEQRQILKKMEQNPKQSAKSVLRRHDKDKIVAKLRKEPQPPPEGPFRVIVADPSWPYEKRPDDGTQRGQTPYPTMTIEEICALSEMIDGLAEEDCILWLWCPNAHLADGNHVRSAVANTKRHLPRARAHRAGDLAVRAVRGRAGVGRRAPELPIRQ